MQDEKYLNYYIETLTGTMTDCVVRNVSMQASAKIKDDIIKEQADKIGEFAQVNEELFNELEDLKKKSAASESEKVNSLNVELAKKGNQISEMIAKHQTEMKRLQDEIRTLNGIKVEFEKVKSSSGQVEVLRNEVKKTREETKKLVDGYETQIQELTARIDELTTPTKKKKPAKVKVQAVVSEPVIEPEQPEVVAPEEIIRDGGSF